MPTAGVICPARVRAVLERSGMKTAHEMISPHLGQGCRIVGLTMGQFSLLDLIRAVLSFGGPAHVSLSTWTVGIRDAETARWLLDTGEIRSMRFLTDRSFATRQPGYCKALVEKFGEGAIRVTKTHAKFALVRGRLDVCIRSSMNLNRNPRYEQFDLDESPELCDFFENLISTMEEQMPPGPVVASAKVDRIFNRVRGGDPRRIEKRGPADDARRRLVDSYKIGYRGDCD